MLSIAAPELLIVVQTEPRLLFRYQAAPFVASYWAKN